MSEKNSLSSRPALIALRERARVEQVLVGLTGISQAGWIIASAAERSGKANFIALWSSLVSKVSDVSRNGISESSQHGV